jgi:predicted alpha/beta superfamily hydrolase
MKKYLFVFLLICFCALHAQDQKPEPVTLHRTEVYTITSKVNGETYPIEVALPASYYGTDKSYPVVYMLDAYSSFGIMVEMQRLLAFDGELPELIIVGISSKGGSKEFIYSRARDFTPTHIDPEKLPLGIRLMTPASGGAEKFLGFITEELIPFIESKFRCKKDDRTIEGHSYGGLFGFYVLFNKPEIFNRYVMISPAVLWDNELILKQEEDFAKKHKSLNAVVYTTVGSLEDRFMIDPWKKLISAIKSHDYNGLTLNAEISGNENHYTIIPYFVTHGLTSVYKK